jgi:hypothetical protein
MKLLLFCEVKGFSGFTPATRCSKVYRRATPLRACAVRMRKSREVLRFLTAETGRRSARTNSSALP